MRRQKSLESPSDNEIVRYYWELRRYYSGGGNLVIQSVQKSDGGWFSCSARNLAGNRESSPAQLKIIGRYPDIQVFRLCSVKLK